MAVIGNGVLEDTLTEEGKEYHIRVEDALYGIYSMMEITNGKTTTIEGDRVEDTTRLLFEIMQRRALREVTQRWPGKRAKLAEVLHYFDRARAFTGASVRLPSSSFLLYSDPEDFFAMQFSELMHTSDARDFNRAAARFRQGNRYAREHAVYVFHGAVYDDCGSWLGYVGDSMDLLDGFLVFSVTADDVRAAGLDPIKNPSYLKKVGVPFKEGRHGAD